MCESGENMGIDIVFRIAAIGMITSVVCQLLNRAGREDVATLAALAGLIVVLMMVISMLGDLMNGMRDVFALG